jgi:hypothetical protein
MAGKALAQVRTVIAMHDETIAVLWLKRKGRVWLFITASGMGDPDWIGRTALIAEELRDPERFRTTHALGHDLRVDTSSREENASKI